MPPKISLGLVPDEAGQMQVKANYTGVDHKHVLVTTLLFYYACPGSPVLGHLSWVTCPGSPVLRGQFCLEGRGEGSRSARIHAIKAQFQPLVFSTLGLLSPWSVEPLVF